MTQAILTDLQIAAMTPAQRRDLIIRLELPVEELEDPQALDRMRKIRLSLIVGGCIVMIPWIGYLATTLPQKYVAHNWPVTWIGFDILLMCFMAATAIFGYLRRLLLLLTGFTTGVLLICDAWFDLMTAGPEDAWLSVITAMLIQVPMAFLLIGGALRVLRLSQARVLVDPDRRLWQLPLLP
ncbi:hypothetical protein MKUB_11500 [Mycobacterium kubicae]|uniref:Uncharacterized protein n=1 Tax=Mycobacterium kubicae TaxID=120959 RepID=A0AAX1JDK0_9MYCO|nr:hypothetical protein [Mycobacterium kubicae]MCV7097940.1 hypothetical protein [Mycobacterium kubicae]ORV94622.1 hypothetical protein AWC13_22345 [Mycobacterium kubicae]QNI10322.1 hypothetical protein GAN18_03050 [Mycobacterium kubicae]QPI38531.1 hypothetical protein I2456_03005 [Mycobacterium kubicae]GFG63660.1 hypothetical protein MKUB_11500 [Mycobacterium kubicae]